MYACTIISIYTHMNINLCYEQIPVLATSASGHRSVGHSTPAESTSTLNIHIYYNIYLFTYVWIDIDIDIDIYAYVIHLCWRRARLGTARLASLCRRATLWPYSYFYYMCIYICPFIHIYIYLFIIPVLATSASGYCSVGHSVPAGSTSNV